MKRQLKIGVFGTHSTGKTSFLVKVKEALSRERVSAIRIPGLALEAEKLGFPILRNHTFESTLWLMTKCITLELEDRESSALLVDRPPVDALGYLLAAVDYRRETLPQGEREYLYDLARHHSMRYDFIAYSKLDPTKPVDNSKPRDSDKVFRQLVDEKFQEMLSSVIPNAFVLTEDRRDSAVAEILRLGKRLIN